MSQTIRPSVSISLPDECNRFCVGSAEQINHCKSTRDFSFVLNRLYLLEARNPASAPVPSLCPRCLLLCALCATLLPYEIHRTDKSLQINRRFFIRAFSRFVLQSHIHERRLQTLRDPLLVASLHAADQPRDLNTPRTFPEISNRAEWQKRATEISEHVQFSCGLWPLPPRTPLNAKVFDRVERDGYTIEKVHFKTYPGFFLAGNLYRPLDKSGKRNTKYPAILNPHGPLEEWPDGG